MLFGYSCVPASTPYTFHPILNKITLQTIFICIIQNNSLSLHPQYPIYYAMSKSYHKISHLSSSICHILCVIGLIFILSSCHGVSDKTRFMGYLYWHEVKKVIATADSLMNLQYITTLTYHKIWVKALHLRLGSLPC